MAERETKDNESSHFGYYAVCLLDILGQQTALRGWSRLPQSGQADAAFIIAVKNTVGTIRWLREAFVDYFQQWTLDLRPELVASLTAEQKAKRERLKTCVLRTQQFSDTFVFHSPVQTGYGDVSVTPMYRMIAACCWANVLALAAGKPVRGAICIGAGTELEPGNFYGPALAEAHHLESEIAQYPRVVVSRPVVEFTKAGQWYSDDREVNEMMRLLATSVRPLLVIDADDNCIVDYLGTGARSIAGDVSGMADAVGKAYAFVRREFRRFSDERNEKLMPRYRLLLDYFERRVEGWGIERQPA